MPGRLGLIVNPTSGKNTGALIGTEALTLLRAAGVDILDLSAADARGALEKGRAAIAAGSIDILVVAGGDGMVHLGANLCAGTPSPARGRRGRAPATTSPASSACRCGTPPSRSAHPAGGHPPGRRRAAT